MAGSAAGTRASEASSRGPSRTLLLAKAAEGEADSVEVGGFAGFVVGIALLPHVVYAIVCAFNIAVRGESFGLGPFGLEFISCVTAVGLTLWSLGSFVQRGRGLPAGPLGLLGLSEGLSYIAVLGLAFATVVSGFRGSGGPSKPGAAPSLPQMPTISMPVVKAPDVKLPDFKVPSFKAPDFKVPDFKAPDFKVPEFKVPDIKVPDIKLPEVKVPELPKMKFEVPKSEPSKSEGEAEKPKGLQALEAFKAKLSEVKPPAPESKQEPEPAKPEAPKAKAPAKKLGGSSPDYDTLFD